MIKRVLDYIKKYHMIEPDDTIVAGISGGADSVCLLFMLLEIREQLPFTLKVVHINHGIRKEAGEDAEFVRMLCGRHQLSFRLVEKNVRESAKLHGLSQEEEGRRVRYQAFEEALGTDQGKIAVAHNSNDRAETMLFHLFRGTGLAGAGGIRPVNRNIIRPLLCLSRKEIEAWLKERQLPYCTDSTNAEDDYTRNRIRHHILTYAEKEICQGAIVNMNRAADQLLEAQAYITRQTDAAMKRCAGIGERGELVIHIPALQKEDPYLQGAVLMNCVERAAGSRKDITAAHIRNIALLFEKTGSKELHLPYGLVVYKKYDLGIMEKRKPHKGQEQEDPAQAEYKVTVPSVLEIEGLGRVEFTTFFRQDSQNIPEKTYTKWFDYDKITSSVVWRRRKKGDYLTINDNMGRQSLQDYFVNQKIPREERNSMYLLAEHSHVLWIPGFRISAYYKVQKDTRRILQVCISDRKEL